MKRISFRRKHFLRALRAAALAFLCWIAAQRQAQAQVSLTQDGSGNLTLSGVGTGSDFLTILSGSGSNVYLSSSTPNGMSFTAGGSVTIQAGTVMNDTSASTYHAAVASGNGGTFSNYGSLNVSQQLGPAGIYVTDSSGNSITIKNGASGSISATSINSASYGIDAFASNVGSNMQIVNQAGAQITATAASSSAYGISASNLYSGGVVGINSLGTVTATTGFIAIGIQARAVSATVDNSGSIFATGNPSTGSAAYGIKVEGDTVSGGSDITSCTVINEASGTISSSSASGGYGIVAVSWNGDLAVTNNGSIQASASNGGGTLAGIEATAFGDLTVTNTGQILATIQGGIGESYGIFAIGNPGGSSLTTIVNATTGQITASSTGSNAYGIKVSSSGADAVSILNAGAITAATTTPGSGSSAYGILATNGSTSASSLYVKNTGTITASGDHAYGIFLNSPGTVYDSGNITSSFDAINVPSGSMVTLAGSPVITGTIRGGFNSSTTSTLNFNLIVRSNYNATVASLDAVIAADAYQNGTASVVINGNTYQFAYFGTVTDGLIQGGLFSQIAGYSGMGGSLDALSSSTNPHAVALLAALGTISDANLPAALAQISAAKVSQQLLSHPASQAVFQNLQLDSRLTQVRSGLADGIDANDFQLAEVTQDPLLSQVQSKLYAYNPAPTDTVSDTPNSLSSDEKFARWGAFLSGNAVLSNQSATASQSRADSTTVDITAGADYRLNRNWAVGFLFGYGRTTADVDSYGSTLDGNQYRFGPYVGYNDGPWYANASGYFAVNQETSERVITFLGQTAHSNPDGTQYGFNADGGYDFKAGHLTYGPTGGLQYTHLNVGAYTETGSDADLSVASQQSDSLLSSIGGKADYDLHWNWNNSTIRPEVRASWLHEFEGSNSPVNAAFDVPGSASFSMAAAHQERESALLGGGVQNIFKGGSLLFVDYDAQVQDNYLAQSITGGFKVLF